MEWWWMQVSVYVYENREGMFEAHLVHSWRGGTGTSGAEMQTQISGGAVNEGRRESVPIKGILTLPSARCACSFQPGVFLFTWLTGESFSGSAVLHEARSHIQTKPTLKVRGVPDRYFLYLHLVSSPEEKLNIWGKVFPQPKPNIPSAPFKAHRKLNSTGNFYPIIIFSFLSVI